MTSEIVDVMVERRQFRNKSDDESIKKYKRITNRITTKCREAKAKDMTNICNMIERYVNIGRIECICGFICGNL